MIRLLPCPKTTFPPLALAAAAVLLLCGLGAPVGLDVSVAEGPELDPHGEALQLAGGPNLDPHGIAIV